MRLITHTPHNYHITMTFVHSNRISLLTALFTAHSAQSAAALRSTAKGAPDKIEKDGVAQAAAVVRQVWDGWQALLVGSCGGEVRTDTDRHTCGLCGWGMPGWLSVLGVNPCTHA